MTDRIASGRRVKVTYRLLLQDGTLVDAADDEPLQFVVGDGTLEPGLESCLRDMAKGESARFIIGPGEAFGDRDPANVHRMPRTDFPPEMSVDVGTVIEFETPNGMAIPGTVLASDGEAVDVDFNHPLAGRPFVFEVHVLDVE